jgi:rod shape-determining protein MreC
VESLLNRYRNITVLALVIMAQLVLIAVSAKDEQDVRFIRIWTVTAVTPVARIIEGLRGGSTGFLHNYILLHDTNEENKQLRAELDRYKMENVFLKNELSTTERAKALQVFQAHTASKTLAATIIATGAGSNSRVVFVDRGTVEGVQRGMAVVTPDGIVGKVTAAFPTASQVQLITDADFAAGVVSQSGQVHGTLKGLGGPQCKVDYVPLEEKLEPGEWLYTSGDDRIFPRGFRVGVVKVVRPSQPFQEILVEPSGLQRGLEDVLILIEGVHEAIPEKPTGMQPVYVASAPPGDEGKPLEVTSSPAGTEADRLRAEYQAVGREQNHTFGSNPPGTKAVDFTKMPGGFAPGAGKPPVGAAGGTPPSPARGLTPAGSPGPTPPQPGTPGNGRPGTSPAGNPSPATPDSSGAGKPPSGAAGNGSPVSATPVAPGTSKPAGTTPAVPGGTKPQVGPAVSPGVAKPSASAPVVPPGTKPQVGPAVSPGAAKPPAAGTGNAGSGAAPAAATAKPATAKSGKTGKTPSTAPNAGVTRITPVEVPSEASAPPAASSAEPASQSARKSAPRTPAAPAPDPQSGGQPQR